MHPSQKSVEHVLALLSTLLPLHQASARRLAYLLGMMESLSLVPASSRHRRLFLREFRARWSHSLQSWEHLIPLADWFVNSIRQWLNQSWLLMGVPLVPPPDEELFTNASLLGRGTHVGSLTALGVWFPDQSVLHINVSELEAVSQSQSLALSQFRDFLS